MNTSFWGAALDFIYPKQCRICRNPMDAQYEGAGYLCQDCQSGIPWISILTCPYCGCILPDESLIFSDHCLCCRDAAHSLSGVIALTQYHHSAASKIRDGILQLKHANRTSFAQDCGYLLAKRINSLYPDHSFDGIVSVPLHRSRMFQRGYNQSSLIGKYLGQHLSVPCCDWLVERVRKTNPQSGNPAARANNVSGAFQINGLCRNANLLLVDDVLTTGATILECTRMLKNAGAASVIAVVVAWVPLRRLMEEKNA